MKSNTTFQFFVNFFSCFFILFEHFCLFVCLFLSTSSLLGFPSEVDEDLFLKTIKKSHWKKQKKLFDRLQQKSKLHNNKTWKENKVSEYETNYSLWLNCIKEPVLYVSLPVFFVLVRWDILTDKVFGQNFWGEKFISFFWSPPLSVQQKL